MWFSEALLRSPGFFSCPTKRRTPLGCDTATSREETLPQAIEELFDAKSSFAAAAEK